MLFQEFIGCFVIVVALFVTQTGGIAGGGVMIPIMLSLFKFDVQNAVAIHIISMAVGGAVRVVYSAWHPHPLRGDKGVQVDYGMASVLLPALILGANFGVIINIMLPELLVLALLIAVLLYITITTGRKY